MCRHCPRQGANEISIRFRTYPPNALIPILTGWWC